MHWANSMIQGSVNTNQIILLRGVTTTCKFISMTESHLPGGGSKGQDDVC